MERTIEPIVEGEAAATAIKCAPSLDEARRIYERFKDRSDRVNPKPAYIAMAKRMRDEGYGNTVQAFDVGWAEGGDEKIYPPLAS